MTSFRTISNSPDDTARLAESLARALRLGDVLVLSGPLASGKTFFVQRLVRALGSADNAVSPTFAIANFYETPLGRFIHLDAYRLSGTSEYADLGLDEFRESGVTAVEWGERLPGAFDEYLHVRFQLSDGADEGRVIDFEPVGERWEAAMGELERLQGHGA